LKQIESFDIKPNIIIDSGNGYHCYWILREPLIDVDEEKKLEFKQILSGLVERLGADKHTVNLDRVLRLPGTYNIKGDEPIECRVESIITDKLYKLEDFEHLKNIKFKEVEFDIASMPDFGSKEESISSVSYEAAKTDIDKLEIKSQAKNMILTGSKLTEPSADKTRSGRDMSIICSLISRGYNYQTIRGVFLNRHLGCSDRVLEGGENKLKWDVMNALDYLNVQEEKMTNEHQKILDIKLNKDLKAEQKRIEINRFIAQDLISGEEPIGHGFRDKNKEIYYFFNKDDKLLMDVEGTDFYLFLRERYGIAKKEKDEIVDAVRTEIYGSKNEIEAHKVAYFDNKKNILYVSDHNNGIFRLDGKNIKVVDNGTDGIFFEYNSEYAPFDIDVSNLNGVNYFSRGEISEKSKKWLENCGLKINEKMLRYGFSMDKFRNEESYLRKYLIDRAHFATEEERNLTPEEQKYLLFTYFYSMFFESIQMEKPIACFVGAKESGKSFIAESIGKILFGEKYQLRHVPSAVKDLNTILGTNYYMGFDNLDTFVKNELIDAFCIAATGGVIEKRKLYTDREIVKTHPKVFIIITTREARFKRDDLVSRLLIFKTKKISDPISRSYLLKTLLENRNNIMAEVLINLNSIVAMLKRLQKFNPPGKSRIADWELFGKKIHVGFPEGMIFRFILEKMNKEKDRFTLEDDPLFVVLKKIVIEDGEIIDEMSASKLYVKLCSVAEDLRMKNFQRRYQSPIALGKRLGNVQDELLRAFNFEISKGSSNVKLYSFFPKRDLEMEEYAEQQDDDEWEPGYDG